ncbi:MAG: hypothetical protein V8R62_11900 [Faecalibacillus intestinalis]|jgi:hypothetical protein
MKDFFKRVLFSNVSEHASSTTVLANTSKFLTSDILKTFMTKLKDTFALKSQLTSLQKRVGQLEKTVSELESTLDDAVYYKE